MTDDNRNGVDPPEPALIPVAAPLRRRITPIGVPHFTEVPKTLFEREVVAAIRGIATSLDHNLKAIVEEIADVRAGSVVRDSLDRIEQKLDGLARR